MRDGVSLDEAVGELCGEDGVAVFFGGQGEKARGGRVVGIHCQRLAEGFSIAEESGGHLGGQLAAKLVDGFGWENHGAWGRSAPLMRAVLLVRRGQRDVEGLFLFPGVERLE